MFWFYLLLISGEAVAVGVKEHTNPQSVTLDFTVPNFEQKENFEKGMQFVNLSMPGAGIINDIGKPDLPVIRKFVEVPEDAELSIEVNVLKEEKIKLPYPVYPKQAPIPKIPNPIIEFTMDTDYYIQDEFSPKVRARIVDIVEIRGHRLVSLEVYPILYNPNKNIIDFASEIQVTIRFRGANWKATHSKLKRYFSIPYESSCKDLIVNYDYYESFIKSPSLPISYLIITPDSWYNTILPLAEWKEQKGYFVTVATLTEVGSGDKNQVRDYIKNAYDTWTIPPTYVILVGDVDKIGYFVSSENFNPATDLNFSLMSAGDFLPDIYVSRFSVASESQLEGLVNKTIKYEKNDWTQGTNWCKKGYFIASTSGSHHGEAEGTHKYCMQKCRANGMVCDSLWGYYGTGTSITTALNEGRSWVMYSGHGSSSSWLGPSFSKSNVHNLSNTDKVPFVGTFACDCGTYTSSECFSESWIRVGTKGGIANFAASISSSWEPDDYLQRRMFDAVFDSGFTWVMGALNKCKLSFYQQYSGTRKYFEMYNMMGDGSIDVYWDIPHTIIVNYPATIPIGPFSLEVTVTDGGFPVNGALVCAKGDTIFPNYTNSSGVATLSVANPDPCTLLITVTGHNLKPFFGTCQVISEEVYVAYLKHSIDDDSTGASDGDEDGIVEPGETIELPLCVKNFGSNTAYLVDGELSTTDPFITITDSLATFGTIASGDSAFGLSSYVFNVNSSVPDSHLVTFDLTCKDNLDSMWVSNFNIVIRSLADIELSPDSLHAFLELDTTGSQIMKIKNVGSDTLRFNIIESAIGKGPRGSEFVPFLGDTEEIFGSWADGSWSGENLDRGNVFYVTEHRILEEIKFYLGISTSTEMYFVVYEGNSLTGTYTLKDSTYIPNSGTGEGWYSSGSIATVLESGKYYYIGTSWNSSVTYGRGTESVPLTCSFGTLETGVKGVGAGLPPSVSVNQTATDKAPYYQTIVTSPSDVPWLSENPTQGTVPPGGSSDIIVSYNSAGLIVDSTYYAWLKIGSNDPDESLVSVPVCLTITESGVTEERIPITFFVSQNYPNPFIGSTEIKYGFSKDVNVAITIYNLLGQKVATLVNENKNAGCYTVRWNGKNKYGKKVASGIYFYRLEAGNYMATKKMYLMR